MTQFSTIPGGYVFSPEEQQLLDQQKNITRQINDGFVQVGAIFLPPTSKGPVSDDWYNVKHRHTNLQDWIDVAEDRVLNVGFNLQNGWIDLDIDGFDPEFNRCIIQAIGYVGLDNRLQFGRKSKGCASHVLLQLGEDEAANFEELAAKAPKKFRYKEHDYRIELRTTPTTVKDKDQSVKAKQTVMPGSVYKMDTDISKPDISVWWHGNSIIKDMSLFKTTPRIANFNEILRAISFGTVLYFIRPHWVKGSRQETALRFCGWLARVIHEGNSVNNNDILARNAAAWCPIDSIDTGKQLVRFICDDMGDNEVHMRLRALEDAVRKYDNNVNVRLAGWPKMVEILGSEPVNAIKTVVMTGTDTSLLAQFADRYLFDQYDGLYVDRDMFWKTDRFQYDTSKLEHQHKGDVIIVNNKPLEAFKIFQKSKMRQQITMCEMWPDLPPGTIHRISRNDVVMNDDEDDEPDSRIIFNTWRSWPVEPTQSVNPAIMEKCIAMLDRLLKYLTCDNVSQAEWIKKWIAFTVQSPSVKQQIAWVCVGGQGVGKSWMGSYFLGKMFGRLAGSADSSTIGDKFSVVPFINKLFVFVDEAKLADPQSIDRVKNLVRSIDLQAEEKFKDPRMYKVYARIMLASNRPNVSSGGTMDRAMYYTKAYSNQFLGMSEHKFIEWTETLKPFFDEYRDFIDRVDVRRHYMRMFMETSVTRQELESITTASNRDYDIMRASMSYSKIIIKALIEEGGNIIPDMDITHVFSISDFNRKTGELIKEYNVKTNQRVIFSELENEMLVEKTPGGHRFKYKLGTLIEKVSEWIGVPIECRFPILPEDYGNNECGLTDHPKWKGSRIGVVERSQF